MNNLYLLIHSILFIINLNLLSFLFYSNSFFEDYTVPVPIILLVSILQHKIFDRIYKTNIFVILSIISLIIGLAINYMLLDIDITIENHTYIFFILFECYIVFTYYLNIKENGP